MKENNKELCFIPLGGVSEIGMNLAVYSYGTQENKEYIIVDMGVSFADEDYPGADLIMPDIEFLEGEALNIKGIIITHGHEDHYGAVAELWHRLQVPIFCTNFTAHLLQSKFDDEKDFEDLPLHLFEPGDQFKVGGFLIDTIVVNHSIPEAVSLAITTDLGTVVHSGDWKIDKFPALNDLTDVEKFKKIGKKGVLALLCDSTNAKVESTNDTEKDVKETLCKIISQTDKRVAITSFSSNIGRIKSIIEAAKLNNRKVLLLGRSIKKTVAIAIELGYLEDSDIFISEQDFSSTPRDQIVIILTGSQGETRASLTKIALKQIKSIELAVGDIVIYSSRMIPGNEHKILRVQNALVDQGVKLITNYDDCVHVSGHAKRGELKQMYDWLKPDILVPVHGQAMHLEAHAQLGREAGIEKVIKLHDGDVLRLAPGEPSIIDKAPVGLLFKDGKLIGEDVDLGIKARRKLSEVGYVVIVLIFNKSLHLVSGPKVVLCGVPLYDRGDNYIYDLLRNELEDYIDQLPVKTLRDRHKLEDGCAKVTQKFFREIWGKRPMVSSIIQYLK